MKKKSDSKPLRRSFSKGSSLFSSLRALIILACAATTWLVLAGKLHPEPTKFSYRPLTFAERVSYQRAIENVYWRHRIWPKENSNPKPSLDAVMTRAQLEKKVTGY